MEIKMQSITRRRFLEDSMLAAAAAAMGQVTLPAHAEEEKATSANNRIRVAILGCRIRGKQHAQELAPLRDCEIVYVCDPDRDLADALAAAVAKQQEAAPKAVQDMRRVFDDHGVDAVFIATPNHWHALAAIWAMQAGKDVYVEKPVSHNVSEGRRIIEAARKYNKICQTGTQSRTNAGMRQSMDYIHSGKLGKVTLARGLCYKLRPSIGKVEGEQPIPKTIDYDLWCGPGPKNPLNRKNLHYDWHWTWDYGNGDLGNQGIHEMDKARWGLGKNELPRSVCSL